MEPLYDECLEETFHEHLVKLKAAVADELGTDAAVPTLASWAGRKPSTIYNWLDRTSKPSSVNDVLRLVINSTRAGYGHFTEWFTGSKYRLTPNTPVFVNRTLDDEAKNSQIVWGRLRQAEEANDGHAVIEGGRKLIVVAEGVVAEGQNMLTAPAIHRPALRRSVPSRGDGAPAKH
jgi:hypothetical protein